MSDESGGERPKLPRTTHMIIFLLIVSSALGGWVWYSTRPLEPAATAATPGATTATQPTVTQASATAVAGATDVPGDGFGVVAGLATPWAVPGGPGEPTATAEVITVEPTPAAAPIQLSGPPPDSFFGMGDVVAFYWISPEPLAAGRQFTVYLLDDGAQVTLGSVDSANLGLGYQIQAVPGQSVEEPGRFSWLVALEDRSSGAIIGQSEVRTLALIADN